MRIKRTFLLLSIILMSYSEGFSQDASNLCIRVLGPQGECLTPASGRLLGTKITQILTNNGIVEDLPSNRFIMTAKAHLLSKDIIPGSPARVSKRLEISFIIGDAIENRKYGTYAVTVTGVGQNEEQACRQAVRTIKVNDPGINAFVRQAKEKIVSYYIENSSLIMKEATELVSEGRFDEALYRLSLVPSACGDVYETCQNKKIEINHKRIDLKGEQLMAAARAEWAKRPNAAGAAAVFPLVSSIPPSASCYYMVSPFLEEIKSKLEADEKRDWEFKIKQYEDEIERQKREFDANLQREAREAEIRKSELDAAKQVAIEFARNQPEEIYNTVLIW